jgi:hypothetical protein
MAEANRASPIASPFERVDALLKVTGKAIYALL